RCTGVRESWGGETPPPRLVAGRRPPAVPHLADRRGSCATFERSLPIRSQYPPLVVTSLESDVDLALGAARGAGALVRHAFGGRIAVAYKSGGQPVTAVDVEADRYLREVLGGARPAYGWISEESDPRTWRSGERVWIVDPLDGTGNFVAGSPEFAVSIGLVERGTPVVGVVYYPVADWMYHA